MNRLDSEEMKARLGLVKTKILEIANDPLKNDLKEFYVMGLITPILDDLGADPELWIA